LYPWGKEDYNSLYYCSPDGTDIRLVTTANQKTFTLLNDKLYYIESDGSKCRVMVSDKDGQNAQQYYDWFAAKSIYQLTNSYVEYGDAANNIYTKYFEDDRLKYMDEGSYANFCYDDGGNLYYHNYSKFFVLTKGGEIIYLDNLESINSATILGIKDGNIYYMTDNKIDVQSYEIFNAEQLAAFDKAAEQKKAADEVSVYLNGTKLDFTQKPVIVNGTTLVPMKAIFEAMGATITWDADTKTVYANCNGKMLEMSVGKDYALIDGEVVSMLTPAQIVNGNTMVPVRVIAQSFGVEPGWDEATRSVTINQ
jgi:prolyl oligopeptidase PreP (S9A serine peptidase family)